MLATVSSHRQSIMLVFLAMLAVGMAFAPSGISSRPTTTSSQTTTTTNLFIFGKKSAGGSSSKPTFDKATETWQKAASDDGEYPYDAVGALLRHGPGPFLKRVTDPKGYEQTVLQYMSATGCSRAEATGNMDAKLNNAADWAYQKLEEKKTGKKVDYTVLNAKDAALTVVWALGITPLVVYSIAQTASQFGTGPSVIKH